MSEQVTDSENNILNIGCKIKILKEMTIGSIVFDVDSEYVVKGLDVEYQRVEISESNLRHMISAKYVLRIR